MSATAAKNVEYYESGFKKVLTREKHNLTVSQRLQAVRYARGYSMNDVVELLRKKGVKVAKSTIQGYEADESKVNHRYPNLHMLKVLSEVYDCSTDYLLGFYVEMEKPTHDMYLELQKFELVTWKGKAISEGQRKLIEEKIDNIMSL